MENEIQHIFTQFEQTNNEIPVSQVQSDLAEYTVILYGAGSAGIAFLRYLQKVEIFPYCFIDGDPAKWGSVCEGLPVLSMQEAMKLATKSTLVIVTINTDGKRYCKSFDEALRQAGHTGVHHALREAGFQNIIDYTYFRRCYGLFCGDEYNLPSCSDVFCMRQNQQNIMNAYELLFDEPSREVFRKIVQFRLLNDNIAIPTLSQENQYFEHSLYRFVDDENFMDCGAYNGITLQTFLRHNPYFSNYYALEPDPISFNHLGEFVTSLTEEVASKIHLSAKGSYDNNGMQSLYSLGGPGSFLSTLGTTPIETVTIDSFLHGRPCSFIKMNIEGAELASLRGAEQTIRACAPCLAISGYHKTCDLWEIPLLVRSLFAGYNLHLRSYMNHISFVYYFIPPERSAYRQ